MAKTFKNNKFGRKNSNFFFSVLYPAADDELERFECCLTGILDGRLYIHIKCIHSFTSGSILYPYIEKYIHEEFYFICSKNRKKENKKLRMK